MPALEHATQTMNRTIEMVLCGRLSQSAKNMDSDLKRLQQIEARFKRLVDYIFETLKANLEFKPGFRNQLGSFFLDLQEALYIPIVIEPGKPVPLGESLAVPGEGGDNNVRIKNAPHHPPPVRPSTSCEQSRHAVPPDSLLPRRRSPPSASHEEALVPHHSDFDRLTEIRHGIGAAANATSDSQDYYDAVPAVSHEEAAVAGLGNMLLKTLIQVTEKLELIRRSIKNKQVERDIEDLQSRITKYRNLCAAIASSLRLITNHLKEPRPVGASGPPQLSYNGFWKNQIRFSDSPVIGSIKSAVHGIELAPPDFSTLPGAERGLAELLVPLGLISNWARRAAQEASGHVARHLSDDALGRRTRPHSRDLPERLTHVFIKIYETELKRQAGVSRPAPISDEKAPGGPLIRFLMALHGVIRGSMLAHPTTRDLAADYSWNVAPETLVSHVRSYQKRERPEKMSADPI